MDDIIIIDMVNVKGKKGPFLKYFLGTCRFLLTSFLGRCKN